MNDREDARPTAVANAAWKGMPDSRRVSRVCKPSIAALFVRRIIGLSIKNNANYELRNYVMKRCSTTHRQRRTAPSASYQCQQN